MPTAMFSVFDALVAKMQGLDPEIMVVSSPTIDLSFRGPMLFVGVDPADDAAGEALVSSTQGWAELGRKAKRESIEVRCQLYLRGGDNDMPSRRAESRAIVENMEAALIADWTLQEAQVLWVSLSSLAMHQISSEQGMTLRTDITLSIEAQLR